MGDEASLAASPKKKKLPFKPTALRRAAVPKPTPPDEGEQESKDDDLDLFRQSKEMAPIVAADMERRRKKNQRKLEEKQRRAPEFGEKRSFEQADDDGEGQDGALDGAALGPSGRMMLEDPFHAATLDAETAENDVERNLFTPPPSKRSRPNSRRLSSRESASSSKKSGHKNDGIDDIYEASPSTRTLRSQTYNTTPIPVKGLRGAVTPSRAPLITIDSDEEDENNTLTASNPTKRLSLQSTVAFEISEGDDQVAFDRQPDSEQDGVVLLDAEEPLVETISQKDQAAAEEDEEFNEYVRRAEEQRARNRATLDFDSTSAPGKKETVDLSVSSDIPNAIPCFFKFLFDKPLRLVRDTWVSHQRNKGIQLPINQNDDIILTWRQRRVYVSSTLLGLGIRPGGNGKIVVDEYGQDGLMDNRTRVHFEAWTTESFLKMEQDNELNRKREAGELSDEESVSEEPVDDVILRVKLVAKDMEEVKLSVRLGTTVETLVNGFRSQRNIPPDKDVGLWFDGERLEEHQTMESADVDDMDSFEVTIK